MEPIFSFLFKYRPLLFQEGDLRLMAPWPLLVTLLVVGVVAAIGILTYTRTPGRATGVERGAMITLRLAALGVLLLCLFQPTLVVTSVVAQRNFVGILVDDSRSMNLPDKDGRSRADWIRETLDADQSRLLLDLSERFTLRFFRFSGETSRVAGVEEIAFDGTRTDLAGALNRAREELSSVPLSGLVLFTDGADNAGTPLTPALVPLQAASVPVFTVGIGEEQVTPDIQIDRVEVPRTVLKGSSLVVDAVVTSRGLGERTVPLIVEDERRILSTQDITLPAGDEPTVVRVRFTMNDIGPQRVRFRIPPQDERVVQNNERTSIIDVRAATEKILYFEGEPRHEVAFMRRALAGDDNLQLVLLQRTAEGKYLRLDVDHGEELAGGFPKTREELFQYRALVLGSVEAGYFTYDQLTMIADFVSQRGGGLLLLGGRNAFAEGGYAGTPLEDVLPVMLETPAADPRTAFLEVKVRPTLPGLNHVATQLVPGQASTAADWERLPALATLNRVVRPKPGATVLLEGVGPGASDTRIVLAHHRYGRGKVIAMPIQDSWLWKMHVDMPLEDVTHETFWRQLLRWLSDGVPEAVAVQADRDQVEAGELVRLTVEVSDSAYREVNDALVTATVTAPDGTVEYVSLDWTLERDGEYMGAFRPSSAGAHNVAVHALRNELPLGSNAISVYVGPSDTEFFDAGLRRTLLERIAQETGGRYYTAANLTNLPEDLRYIGGGITLAEELELWDMPILFLLLVGLIGCEWAFRRKRGLV